MAFSRDQQPGSNTITVSYLGIVPYSLPLEDKTAWKWDAYCSGMKEDEKPISDLEQCR